MSRRVRPLCPESGGTKECRTIGCRYAHVACKHYNVKTGKGCRNGEQCAFMHPGALKRQAIQFAATLLVRSKVYDRPSDVLAVEQQLGRHVNYSIIMTAFDRDTKQSYKVVSAQRGFWEHTRPILVAVPQSTMIPPPDSWICQYKYHSRCVLCHRRWPDTVDIGEEENVCKIDSDELWTRFDQFWATENGTDQTTTWLVHETDRSTTDWVAFDVKDHQSIVFAKQAGMKCPRQTYEVRHEVYKMLFVLWSIINRSWSLSDMGWMNRLDVKCQLIPHKTEETAAHENEQFFTRDCVHRTWSSEFERFSTIVAQCCFSSHPPISLLIAIYGFDRLFVLSSLSH